MRVFTVSLSAALAALAVVASGSGSRTRGPNFSVADLVPIVAVKPPKPKQLTFVAWDPYVGKGPTFTLNDYLADTKDKAFVAQLRNAGFRLGGHTRWDPRGNYGDLYAAVEFADLFRDAPGAGAWLGDLQGKIDFKRSKTIPHGELGSRSVGRYSRDNDEVAVCLWRRGNLVLLAVMNCEGPCGFDLAGRHVPAPTHSTPACGASANPAPAPISRVRR